MIDIIKKNKYLIIELTVIFILSFLFNLICSSFDYDEIWCYGFSYNIVSGLVPYKDFNMVITPLFPLIGSIFIYIFGKSIVVFYILNAFMYTAIFYFLKKQTTNKNYYLAFQMLMTISMVTYNVLCILFLYILMYMEEKKSNDYLIGIILGLTFLTKQNIGIYLCIPTLLTKNIKKIIKRIIGFIIPNIIIIMYLILNGAFYEYIDYAFLGIGSFAKENITIHTLGTFLLLVSIIYLIYKYIKTKDVKLLYIICFQGMAYPIFNEYHLLISFTPTFAYIVSNININQKILKYYFLLVISLTLLISAYDLFNGEYIYPNNTINYKYKKIDNNTTSLISDMSSYIKEIDGKVFIMDELAYLFKLEANITINKYDLLNDGNLGKGKIGQILKEIDSICKVEECTFLLKKEQLTTDAYNQYSDDLYLYVMDNYIERGQVRGYTVYK